MTPRVDPKKSSQRDSSFFSDIEWKQFFSTGRGVLKVLVLVVICALLLVSFYDFYKFVRTSPRLAVNLQLRGNKKINKSTVRKALTFDPGDKNSQQRPPWAVNSTTGETISVLAISPSEIRNRLVEKIKRFKEISVRKELPRNLIIQVEERKPVGLVRLELPQWDQRRFKPADREGVVFDLRPKEKEKFKSSLPYVLGLEEMVPGSKTFRRHWDKFLRVRKFSREIFNRRIVKWYEVKPGGVLKVKLSRPRPLVIHLGKNNFRKKTKRLYEIMTTDEFQQIENYIDLSEPNDIRAK